MRRRLFIIPFLWAMAWGSCSGDPACRHDDPRYAAMGGVERDIRAALTAFSLSAAGLLIAGGIYEACKES